MSKRAIITVKHDIITCINTTDIYQRSQTSHTALCNDFVTSAMWLNLGVFRVLADHTRKNKRKTNAITIFAHHEAFCAVFVITHRLWYVQ